MGYASTGSLMRLVVRWINACLQREAKCVTYNVLINGFCKKIFKKAREWFNDIRNQGLAPNVITYNTLIDACCKDGMMKKVNVIRSLMLERGIFPKTLTFYCRITGSCRQGNIDMTMKLLHEMEAKGLEADLITCIILTDGLCKVRGLKKGGALLLDEMLKKGFVSSTLEVQYSDGSCMATAGKKPQDIFECSTIYCVDQRYCMKGKLLYEILEKGLIPNQTTYEIVNREMLDKGFVPDKGGHRCSISSL